MIVDCDTVIEGIRPYALYHARAWILGLMLGAYWGGYNLGAVFV